MRRVIAIALAWTFLVTSAKAVREIVIYEDPLPAQRVEGVAVDPSGAPIPGMTVTDRTENWGAVLRSTTTDTKGHFRFSKQTGKGLYYLRFDKALFNPLQVKLQLDKKASERGITANAPIGG